MGLGRHLLMKNTGLGIFKHFQSTFVQNERIGVISEKGDTGLVGGNMTDARRDFNSMVYVCRQVRK